MVKWKKDRDNRTVKDFKFDFVDIHEFEKHDCMHGMRYSIVFFLVLKAVLVYIADLYSMTALLLNESWVTVKPALPIEYAKWIFFGSILMSFVLLFLEIRKALAIVKSRDISFAFTNMIAYRYYTLTSYPHWCFFQEIRDREKFLDKVAFHVFFEFKGYKRLLLCDGPRQIINAITVYTFLRDKRFSVNLAVYGSTTIKTTLAIMSFTVAVFAISALSLLFAFLLYLPLLCKIQGNLKEYCCHIIDKRIGQLLEQQKKKRVAEANRTKQTKGPQPTLPEIDDNNSLPQYNDPSSKVISISDDPLDKPRPFSPSDVPPDSAMIGRPNYNAAADQGYYVRNPNNYLQKTDSIISNPTMNSSSVPIFQNYNNSSRRGSNSSATGQIFNERSNSPGFNPRQNPSSTGQIFNERSNSPGFSPRQNPSSTGQIFHERSNSPGFSPRQNPSSPLVRQAYQPPYIQQSSSQPIYQQRSPRIQNVAGPQSSISSPIVRPRPGMNNSQQPSPDPYYQVSSAQIPNVSQYNYNPSLDYYNNQMSQLQSVTLGENYIQREGNEISQSSPIPPVSNIYNPQDQRNVQRYDNYS